MSEDRKTVEIERIATTSLMPPPPLGAPDGQCAQQAERKTMLCEGLPRPAPIVPVPPPQSTVACYTGMTLDGRYKVETVLGEGGMGIVYLARHRVIDKRVAVKILRSDFAHQKDITDRFLQEAKAASSIGNPHIVDISDFGELPDGSTYFVMEWLDGVPLSKITRDAGPVPLARLVGITRQIADGLAAAHAVGIVHRDLKPDNVFLLKRGNDDFVKILDFGIAKVSNDASKKMTRAGALFGTPHYMSPEQAAGTPVDARTDIYALGVILYEMASGRLPFDSDNLMGILTQHMFKAPPPIRHIESCESISPGLEAVIMKALSKHPDQRYATMQALSDDLDKVVRGERPDALGEMTIRSASMFPMQPVAPQAMSAPIPAHPRKRTTLRSPTPSGVPQGLTPSGVPQGRRRGRTPWGVYAGVTAILVACSLVVGVFLQSSSSRAQVSRATAATSAPPVVEHAASESKPVEAIAPPIQVLFAAQPLDAHVFRGDEDLGTTPIMLDVPKDGELKVEVRRHGFRPRTVVVDGSEKKVSIKLAPGGERPRVAKPAPARGGKARPKGSEHAGEIINPWPTR